MAYLTDKERRELKQFVLSKALRVDARALRQSQGTKISPRDFLRFVTGLNALVGHRRSRFRKIKGDHFLL